MNCTSAIDLQFTCNVISLPLIAKMLEYDMELFFVYYRQTINYGDEYEWTIWEIT
jgi:predicted adenine nucleotide alpha hydrolase (AANH) superfamily ATPase